MSGAADSFFGGGGGEKIAVVIPAYREQGRIGPVVRAVRAQAELACVTVVDDGSPDATAAEAEAAGAEVLRHSANRGKGAAIKTGLRHALGAGCDAVILLDGDGQHAPSEIGRFLQAARERPEVLLFVGNRMEAAHEMPVVRKAVNRLMSAHIGWLCRQRIPDSQCGFRMVRRGLIPHLLGGADAYDYETEMLLVTARLGRRIGAVPVSTIYGDEKSKIHPWRDTLRYLRLMARQRRASR